MSGEVTNVKCRKCGKFALGHFDWKPVQLEINECPHYECGFSYYNNDGVVKTFYQTKEEIKELRIYMYLEQEVA